MNARLVKHGLYSLLIGWLPIVLAATPAHGAERLSFSFGLLEFSISVDSLEAYAQEGEVDQGLAAYAHYLDSNHLTQLREILTDRIELDSVEVSQFLYSSSGELVDCQKLINER